MIRSVLLWAGAVLLGVLIGAGSAFWTMEHGGRFMQRRYGEWAFNPLAGAPAADPYSRAIVARTGLLALNATQTIYFNLDRDSDGRPLREGCVYEVRGGPLPARWWSVTIYAPDNFLPRNGEHAFSIDQTHISQDAAGRWSARLSAARGDALHWISTRAAGRGFSLTLRLYQPRQEARSHPETLELPELVTLSCPGASR